MLQISLFQVSKTVNSQIQKGVFTGPYIYKFRKQWRKKKRLRILYEVFWGILKTFSTKPLYNSCCLRMKLKSYFPLLTVSPKYYDWKEKA